MKKYKKLIITLLILILLPIGIFTIDFGVQSCVVMNYLCQKYDAKVTDFKLVKYMPKHTKHFTPKSAGWFETRHYGANWQYQYNDRIFNVQKIKGTNIYFDDYQLEDISKWATEYLQENVDPNIIHVNVVSENIYYLSRNCDYFKSKAVNQNNILEYLNYFEGCTVTYHLEDDILDSEKNELKTILKQNDSIPFKVIITDFKQEIVSHKRIHGNYFFRDDNCSEYCYIQDEFY